MLEPMRVDRGKHWHFAGIRHGSAHSAANRMITVRMVPMGQTEMDVGADPDLLIVTDYLNELGYLAQDLNRAALANMCRYVFKGSGHEHDLKDKAIYHLVVGLARIVDCVRLANVWRTGSHRI